MTITDVGGGVIINEDALVVFDAFGGVATTPFRDDGPPFFLFVAGSSKASECVTGSLSDFPCSLVVLFVFLFRDARVLGGLDRLSRPETVV